MRVFERLVSVCIPPLILLNTIGAVIAGVWLAALGQWGMIGWGVLIVLIGYMVLPLIMAPGALLSFPLAHAIGRRRYAIASGFVFLAALYDITIITIWCVGVLSFFGYRADVSSVIPALLWSYSIATRPIVGMANGEDGGAVATWATVFFAQLGYAVMMLGVMAGVTPGQLVALFAVVMSGSVLVRLAMIVQLRAHTMPRAAA